MLNDSINRLARARKTPVRVRAILKEGNTVSVFAAGRDCPNSRAFLSRFFPSCDIFVTFEGVNA